MRILELCKKFPFPLKDGESLAIHNLSRSLQINGCQLDLLAMNTSKHHFDIRTLPADYSLFEQIHSVEIDNRIRWKDALANLLSGESYHISRFISTEFERKLIELLRRNPYDIVQLETIYLAPYISVIRKHSKALIALRAHNLEHEIWERLGEQISNPFKRMYVKHAAAKLKQFEIKAIRDVDLLIPISLRDQEHFLKTGYAGQYLTIPVGIDLNDYLYSNGVDFSSKAPSIAFIGSLDWMPNVEGLKWFLEHVWPKVQRMIPRLEFHIAGRNTPEWLKNKRIVNTVVHGEVESLTRFLYPHNLVVVPIFSGSGMRVKILESMAMHKPVITTSLGLEGIDVTDGKEVIIADVAEEMIYSINRFFKDPAKFHRMGEDAYQFVREHHNLHQLGKKLADKYRSLLVKDKAAVNN